MHASSKHHCNCLSVSSSAIEGHIIRVRAPDDDDVLQQHEHFDEDDWRRRMMKKEEEAV